MKKILSFIIFISSTHIIKPVKKDKAARLLITSNLRMMEHRLKTEKISEIEKNMLENLSNSPHADISNKAKELLILAQN